MRPPFLSSQQRKLTKCHYYRCAEIHSLIPSLSFRNLKCHRVQPLCCLSLRNNLYLSEVSLEVLFHRTVHHIFSNKNKCGGVYCRERDKQLTFRPYNLQTTSSYPHRKWTSTQPEGPESSEFRQASYHDAHRHWIKPTWV